MTTRTTAHSDATKPTCAVVYDQKTRRYCGREATMFALRSEGIALYCAEHGRTHGAADLDPTDVARAEAETRAHSRVSPVGHYDAIAAVNLYVEAFVAGARFEAARRDGAR